METRNFSFTRGDLVERVPLERKSDSIKGHIDKLMAGIGGSVLVREDGGFRIGDEYHAVYFLPNQSACVKFDAEAKVDGKIYAKDDRSANEISYRLRLILDGK